MVTMLQLFVRCLIRDHILLELGMIFFFSLCYNEHHCNFSSTGNDEMCNFYIMYWVDSDRLLDDNVCTSPGPPQYYFSHDRV